MKIMDMMKQAQQLQSKVAEMQTELEEMEIEGQAGAGLVSVSVNGKGDIKSIKIDPTLMKPDETEILEDLIIAAANDAKTKSQAMMQEKMQSLTGGLPIPPGMKLF